MIARALVAVATLLFVAAPARAGDRRLEVIFVNMTPDAQSSEASKACVKAIEKRLAADYTEMKRLGETAVRKQAGKSAGEPMITWPLASFDAIKSKAQSVDTVVLVDCRPDAQSLDVVVAPASKGLAHLQLRRVALDAAALAVAAEALLRRAWSGFSP